MAVDLDTLDMYMKFWYGICRYVSIVLRVIFKKNLISWFWDVHSLRTSSIDKYDEKEEIKYW